MKQTRSYEVAETKGTAFDTLCHIARKSGDVWNVKSLCGTRLSWILGEYEDTPSGWNLCAKCDRSKQHG